MKKKILFLLVPVVMLLSGCNKQVFDTVYSYDYAYIYLQNGECVEGKIKNWDDYENSDQLQITMENGDVYLVHSTNCTLIRRK